jgi:hypothetical protein
MLRQHRGNSLVLSVLIDYDMDLKHPVADLKERLVLYTQFTGGGRWNAKPSMS